MKRILTIGDLEVSNTIAKKSEFLQSRNESLEMDSIVPV